MKCNKEEAQTTTDLARRVASTAGGASLVSHGTASSQDDKNRATRCQQVQ